MPALFEGLSVCESPDVLKRNIPCLAAPANQDPKQLQTLLRPFPADRLAAYPVSTAVNSPRNDSADLLHRQA